MNKYEIHHDGYFRNRARHVLKERPDLRDIAEAAPKIAYMTSKQEKKTGNGTKLVLADCKKVPDIWQWCCPYDFIITIYTQNCVNFDGQKYEILLWHELKHIGIKPDAIDEDIFFVRPHDYEEFAEIIDAYGLDWNKVQ